MKYTSLTFICLSFLGQMYCYGQSQPNETSVVLEQTLSDEEYKEYEEYAKVYIQESTLATQGDADAQFSLGMRHYNEAGKHSGYSLAKKWFEKAAIQGHPEAQYNLGLIYYEGLGKPNQPKPIKEALLWWKPLAEKGHVLAQRQIGKIYLGLNQLGIFRDLDQAFTWLEKAALQGDAEASYYLGLMYYYDRGVLQDFDQAFIWMEKASLQEDLINARYYLALMYLEGDGVTQDKQQAFKLMKSVALKNVFSSQLELIEMYKQGDGVIQSDIDAFAWLDATLHFISNHNYVEIRNKRKTLVFEKFWISLFLDSEEEELALEKSASIIQEITHNISN